MLPDAALRPLLADDVPLAVLHPDWAARFPREVLTAVGVLDGFAVVVDEEPVGPDHDLDDEDRWWDGLAEPPTRLVAVRDLDLVDDTAWPAALALLAAERDTREAAMSGYTAWWLARHARLGGRRPGHWRLGGALAALYARCAALSSPTRRARCTGPRCRPLRLARRSAPRRDAGERHPAAAPTRRTRPPDDALLVAIGVRRDLRVADARAADDLLARLADPHRHPSAGAGRRGAHRAGRGRRRGPRGRRRPRPPRARPGHGRQPSCTSTWRRCSTPRGPPPSSPRASW